MPQDPVLGFLDLDQAERQLAKLIERLGGDNEGVSTDRATTEPVAMLWPPIGVALGYLRSPTKETPLNEAELEQGLVGLLADAGRDSGIPEIVALRAEASVHRHEIDDRLAALLAGDHGGPSRVPGVGEVGLWSRIVQARLFLLGFLEGGPRAGQPFGATDLAALRALGDRLELTGSTFEDLVELTGDTDAVLAAIIAHDPHGYVVFQETGKTDPARERLYVDDHGKFAESAHLLPPFRPNSQRPRHLDHSTAVLDPVNRLALRSLQLRLWRLGLLNQPPSPVTDYRRAGPDEDDKLILGGIGAALRIVASAAPDPGVVLRDRLAAGYWAINPRQLRPILLGLDADDAAALALREGASGDQEPLGRRAEHLAAAERVLRRIRDAKGPLRHLIMGEPIVLGRIVARTEPVGDTVLIAPSDVTVTEIDAAMDELIALQRGLVAATSLLSFAANLAKSPAKLALGPPGWLWVLAELRRDLRNLRRLETQPGPISGSHRQRPWPTMSLPTLRSARR